MELNVIYIMLIFLNLALSIYNVIRTHMDHKYKKQKAWYNKEILNIDKINNFYDQLEKIACDSEISITEKCREIDKKVLEFCFNTIDYTTIINNKYSSVFKRNVTSASDELMQEVIKGTSSNQELGEIVRKNRFIFLKLLIKNDILGDLRV